jgi:sulfur transfer complex TusBCD TusB component (DsrH family)
MIYKRMIFCSLLIISFVCAEQSKISVKNFDKIELCFENVRIEEIDFSGKSEIKITFDSEDDVTVRRENNKVIIAAPKEKTEIRMILPERKTYTYTMKESDKEAYCQFTEDKFNLYQEEEKIVSYKDGILLIMDEDNETVIKVDDEKIYIRDDDGTETEISSKGITSNDKEDEDQFDGFWGKVVGNAIQYAAHLAITELGDSPGAMAKIFINSDLDGENEININFE